MQKHSSLLLSLVLSCLFFLGGIEVYAAKEKFLAESGLNNLPGDSLIRVSDTGYTSNASLIESHRLRRNIISLAINEHSGYYVGGNFRSVVYLRYQLKNYNNHLSDYITDSLVVTYDTLKGYNLRDYRVFEDVQESSVRVTGYATNNSSIDVRGVLKLTNEIELDRSYKWPEDNCSVKVTDLVNVNISGPADSFDELPVSWTPLIGSDEYDLEWTWIDEEAPGHTTPTAAVFTNNASRVTVRGVSYNIPLLFDGKGKLCYRVRPVKLLEDGSRKTGLWSHQNGGTINSYVFNGFQRKLNWQATTSYAEEGKRKSVVNYFDGSLRSRQTVTKDNSTTVDGKNNAVIAETFYDYQGRAAVQVLPAPSVSTLLTYVKGFNKNINTQDYDKDDFDKLGEGEKCCGKAAGKMDPATSGASHYYSPQSIFLEKDATKSYSKFVPDADSTPFIQTEYSLDNTGRIARQGGVGKDYQLSKHDTRYYYGKPSQRELDILFGTEVGNASHYFKNMVRDANGQYSVSYMDMQGRTIATALAGNLPDSIKLDDIAESLQFRATDTIIRKGNQLTDGLSIVKSEGIVVPVSGEYKIDYSLDPERLVIENCAKEDICYDCLYDFEIMMIEDCGDTLFYDSAFNISLDNSVIETTIDGTCNGKPFVFSKTLNVPEGSYTLTKRLRINRESLEAYRDKIFLVQNTCRDYESFLKEEIDILKAELPCVVSCEDCFTALGSEASFVSNYVSSSGVTGDDVATMAAEAATAYKSAYASCAALCPSETSHYTVLEMTEDEMLGDVTPPYGIYANPAVLSYVFGKTGGKYNYQNATYVYKNAQGITDRVVNSKGQEVLPNELSPEEFTEHFKPSWAQELLKLHPEKCKLDRAKTWAASYKYDDLLRNTTTYADALSKGLLNAPSSSLDPALNSALVGDAAFRNTFSTRLMQYAVGSGSTSIWHLAVKMISCMESPATNCMSSSDYGNSATALNVSSWCEGDRDMAWTSFRSLYLSVKDKILYERLHNLCGSTEGAISAANRRFVPPASGSESPSSADTRTKADLATAVADACQGYTSLWMKNLEYCRYTTAQWEALSARLVSICKDGGDIKHFNGASTVAPGITNAYANSFTDAVKRFNTENGINTNEDCNGYLIVQPPPYDAPNEVLVNTIVAQRPDANSCLCKNLNYYYEEKQASANSGLTLGAYLREFYGAEIEDATADILRAVCNEPATDCKFLSTQYVVGPVLMNCDALKPACLDCEEVKGYHLLFKSEFGTLTPTLEGNDTTQQQVNLLYQRFMNYHTGFNEDHTVYLDFLQSCALSDTGAGANCVFIDSIYNNFKKGYYRERKNSRDNASGCDISYWNSNYGGGYAQEVPLNEIMENGLFKAKRQGNAYSSIDYNDTLDFAPFTFETRVKFPRTGHRYNPFIPPANPYTFLLQFNVQHAGGSWGRMQFAFDMNPGSSTSYHYLYDSVPVTGLSGSFDFDEWRNLKIVVSENKYSLYIDNVFIRDYHHYKYRKFAGFMVESFGESFRLDWIKIKNQCDMEVMNESFSSCIKMDYIKKKLTDNCTDCRSAFTGYFNTGSGRSYSYNFTQLDSMYRNNCNRVLDVCGPPALSGDSCAVIRYYMDLYTQEMSMTDTLYPVNIVTSLGNLTPLDGPKGVFDVEGKLVGNTTGGTPLQIKQSFAAVWNSSVVNRKVGHLQVSRGELYLKLKSGAIYPCNGIVGMRYYQMDIENSKVWGIHTGIGSYVDWGDGTGDHIMGPFVKTNTESSLISDALTMPANNTRLTFLPLRYSLKHDYTGGSVNRTISVYHPDTLGVVGNRRETDPAFIYNLKNLRGYFPEKIVAWEAASSMDTSFNTYNKIVNFGQVSGLRYFMQGVDYLRPPNNDTYYAQFGTGYVNNFGSFAGKSDIERVYLDVHTGGLVAVANRAPIINMFPDWNVNFPNIASIYVRGVHGEDYNRDVIRYKFPKLKYMELWVAGLTTASADMIIDDVATTTQICGGYLRIHTYGQIMNIAGLNAANIAYLQSRGWKVEITSSSTSVVYNATGTCTTAAGYQIQPMLQRANFPMRSSLSEYLNAKTGFNMSAFRLTQKMAAGACNIVSPCSRVLPKTVSANKLCGRSRAIFPVVDVINNPPCADTLLLAGTRATMRYEAYLDSLKNAFETQYIERCLKVADHEKLTIEKPNFEYHYTLYYYDQGGNLVRTVPPESVNLYRKELKNLYSVGSVELGLKALESEVVARREQGTFKSLPYTLATHYRYNSLNQVTEQRTPDAGTSYFWYDELGRLVVSRNAKQALENKFSYTRYDALGRIIEVGETGERMGTNEQLKIVTRDPDLLLAWLNTDIYNKPLTQITRTVYDVTEEYLDQEVAIERFSQNNLRNRVSYTKVVKEHNNALTALTQMPEDTWFPSHSTYYDYDIHGNVKNLINRFGEGEMGDSEDRDVIKHIRYDYDLVSGKVNMVSYQPNYKIGDVGFYFKDRFYHRYEYDAENKLTEVYTSTDSVYWEKDAAYKYYRHGPLARVELGQAKVQGVDYAYTVQGWLKGINSSFTDAGKDIGADGRLSPANGGNNLFARDAIGFSIMYNGSDYHAIGNGVAGAFVGIDKSLEGVEDHYKPLFNGNIMGTTLSFDNNLKVLGQPESNYSYAFGKTFTRLYSYDKLNRIKKSQSYTELQDNQFVKFNVSKGLNESFEYDANGNILRLDRYGVRGASFEELLMDSLEYQYIAGTNKLKFVKDNVTDHNRFKTDIDDQGQNNYSYDAIGNLVSDKSENIKKITWTVYGKIDSIYKYNGNTITYRYDAAGNRVSKFVRKGGKETETGYVRDAQGNVMAVYEYNNDDDAMYLTETHLYGSSRLGVYKRKVEIWGANVENNYEWPYEISGNDYYGKKRSFERGNKFFELSNHLGNVLATVSDRKIAVGTGTNVSYYKADIKTASDYYAFGAPIDVRNYPHAVWQMQSPAEDGGSAASPVTLYQHSFNGLTTGSVPQPYTEEAGMYSDYVSNMNWTTSHPGGLTIQGGQTGQALAIPTAQPASSTMTLSLDVREGHEASISGFSFYIKNENSAGYKNWNLSINGQSAGSGVVTSSFALNTVTLAAPVRGLKGAVTVQLTLSNSSGLAATNYLRVDDFKLNGFVELSPKLTGGNNIVHQADFSSSTAGWVPHNGVTTVTLEDGKLRVSGSSAWGAVSKSLTLTVGKTYRISFTVNLGNCVGGITMPFYKADMSTFYWSSDVISINADGRYTTYLTPETSNLRWLFEMPPGTSNGEFPSHFTLDDVIIEEVNDPVSEDNEDGLADGNGYRYGFNGQEKSDEIKGSGNSYHAEYWEYDPRLGRRWNLDPKPTVGVSEYATFFNNPIWNNDVYGDSPSLRIGIFLDFESKYKEVYQVDKDYANLNPQLSVTIPYFNVTLIALNYEKNKFNQAANRERTRKLNGGMRGSLANKTDAHEAAPAMTKQGGGANNSQNIMRIVDASLNRQHGSGLKNAVKNLQDGDPLIMVLIPEKKKTPVFVPATVIVPDIKPIPIAKPVLEPGFWEKVWNYSILTRAMMTTAIQTGTDLLGEKLRTAQQIQNARECACP